MVTEASHVWKPSNARLLAIDVPLPGTRAGLPVPLVWPAKDAADLLDYQFDISPALAGNDGDGIASLDVSIAPAETGGLTLASAVADGPRAVLWLGGGWAGRTYTVTVRITTESGRGLARDISLPVLQLARPLAPASALLAAPGQPITDQNGNVITV